MISDSLNEFPFPDADDDVTIAAVSKALDLVNSAIGELTVSLEEANDRLGHVVVTKTAEREIGRLFLKAQHFADVVVAEAEERAIQIVSDAEAEADKILSGAKSRAGLPPTQSESGLSNDVLKELSSTIAAMNEMNSRLVEEIGFLQKYSAPAWR